MVQQHEMAQRLEQELTSAREQLARLDADITALTRDNAEEGGAQRNHMGDEGSNDYERERLMTMRVEIEARARMIESAQQRIGDGSYGTCQRCGKPIASERLEALPFAAYCIDCQEVVDREQDVTGVKQREPLTP